MLQLQLNESYTNQTTKDLTVKVIYYNSFGERQTDIRILGFKQTFTRTQPTSRVYIYF